ncbi:hypothetical protein C2845_PM03G05510 [Panicum miliaceum]|uniref:Uncharacterized protein n=1 Tax=Panicum miliaceum TaxID=4540 RepID=A0A3L6TC82_PANMI|nr:hypothetical protein C2845_PM03G05510 [Panicum miliaceum]
MLRPCQHDQDTYTTSYFYTQIYQHTTRKLTTSELAPIALHLDTPSVFSSPLGRIWPLVPEVVDPAGDYRVPDDWMPPGYDGGREEGHHRGLPAQGLVDRVMPGTRKLKSIKTAPIESITPKLISAAFNSSESSTHILFASRLPDIVSTARRRRVKSLSSLRRLCLGYK